MHTEQAGVDLRLIYQAMFCFASTCSIFLALFCMPRDFSSLRAAKAFTAFGVMAVPALMLLYGHKKLLWLLFVCLVLCFLCSQQHQQHEISPHKPSQEKTNMPTMAPCTRQSKPAVAKVINQSTFAPAHTCPPKPNHVSENLPVFCLCTAHVALYTNVGTKNPQQEILNILQDILSPRHVT